jgi:REP element-mobilizing transposase RayT
LAYQLNWSVTVFWRVDPKTAAWLEPLQALTEPDGIRVLQHGFREPTRSVFLVSTRPPVAPATLVARLKGRLQHLLRSTIPRAFQRNYALRSIGSTRRDKLEHYLAGQLQHHPPADERVREQFARYQIHNPTVDLAAARATGHARFWYNLHGVLVNAERWREIRDEVLLRFREMLLRASAAKGHLLSQAAFVPDHLHFTLGCHPEEAPAEVILSYMNNLAYVWGMKAIFPFSGFVGTFGEYDLGAVR